MEIMGVYKDPSTFEKYAQVKMGSSSPRIGMNIKNISVQGFLAQAQEDATLLSFSTKSTLKPPALLALTFRKLRNSQPYQNERSLASSLFRVICPHDVMRFSRFPSFLVSGYTHTAHASQRS